MAKTNARKNLDDLFAQYQLQAINQRLDDIQKENKEQQRNKDNLYKREPSNVPLTRQRRRHLGSESPTMDRYSLDFYSRYGPMQRPSFVESQDGHGAMFPSYGSFVNPVVYPAIPPPAPPAEPSHNSKTDVMEMLLLQGAQMHQHVMQHMMMSSLRPNQQTPASITPPSTSGTTLHQASNGDVLVPVSITDILNPRLHWGSASGQRWKREDGQPSGNKEPSISRGELASTRNGEHLIPLSLAQELFKQRPQSVHHHHHGAAPEPDAVIRGHSPLPQTPRTIVQLPPVQTPPWSYQPVKVVPMPQPPADITPGLEVVQDNEPGEATQQTPALSTHEQECQTEPASNGASAEIRLRLPFPGDLPLRRFRHAGYAAIFCAHLQQDLKRKHKELDFQFEMRLREMAHTAKGLYVSPNSDLKWCYSRLTAEGATDLQALLVSGDTKAQKPVFGRIMDIIQDITDIITENTAFTGLLGVDHRSAIYQLVQNGISFPEGYLWELEKTEFLRFDLDGGIKGVEEEQAIVLLLGLLICRAFAIMVLLEPSSLTVTLSVELGSTATSNLKVIASLFIVICLGVYSKVYKWDKKRNMVLPTELETQLCTMQEMAKFRDMKHSAMQKVQKQLQKWAASYYKKLRDLDKKR